MSVTSRSCRSCFSSPSWLAIASFLSAISKRTAAGAKRYGAGREVPPARRQRPRGLGDQPRLLADLRRRRRARQAEACAPTPPSTSGINFIDTANVYGARRGRGVPRRGARRPRRATRTSSRRSSSSRCPTTDRGLSREQIRKQIDASLARLRTDYVDLYQCHRYDGDTPLEETMEALTEVVRAGKARYLGFSEWPAEQIQAALDAARRRELRLEPAAVLDALARARARASSRSARRTASRRSSGRRSRRACSPASTSPGEPPPDGLARGERRRWARFMDRLIDDDVLERGAAAAADRRRARLTMAQLALAWVLREPNVASAIVGASPARAGRRQRRRLGRRARRGHAGAIDEALGRG